MAQASIPLRDRAQPDRRPYFPAGSREVAYEDVENTGPEGLGGRYLRKVWQPVFHSQELPIECAPPVRALNEKLSR